MSKYLLYICLFFGLGFNALGQKNQYFKAGVIKDGVYKIDLKYLKSKGVQIKNINPNYIRVFATGIKELPQLLQAETAAPVTWKEIPTLTNDRDGKLDKTDYLLFYAEGPDKISLEGGQENFDLIYQKHSYANEAFVLIEINSATPGLKINKSTISTTNTTATTEIKTVVHHELNTNNLLKTGREWYGEYLSTDLKITIETPNINNISKAKLTARVIGKTYEDTELEVQTNGVPLGNMPLKAINYRRNDAYRRYLRAGEISTQTFDFLPKTNSQDIDLLLSKDIDISSGAYLDYVSMSYLVNTEVFSQQYQGYTFDQNPSFKNNFAVKGYQIWNVTEPLVYTQGNNANDFITFSETKDQNPFSKFAFFDLDHTYTPGTFKEIEWPKEDVLSTELLIIYPEFFKKEAELLATHRRSYDELKVSTASLEDIYLLHSGGMLDPTAIRNYAYQYMPSLRYLVLFGDANYDLHNPFNLSYIDTEKVIPTYQSKESLEPIYSYCTDDYYAYLSDGEGTLPEGVRAGGSWISPEATDAKMDIGVGRLPVKNKTEARFLVEKLIERDYGLSNESTLIKSIYFVADDGDNNIHVQDTEDFSRTVIDSLDYYLPEKILVDAYPQLTTENGERSPEAVQALEKAIADGAYIINYNGHGSPSGWTDEKLLTVGQIMKWQNTESLPIFFTATCEFGRYDDPAEVSGAELALLNPYGGAAALLTTTRPVFSSTNHLINDAFYSIALKNATENSRLGDVFKETKNNAESGQINRNFSMLGDPSMLMDIPNKNIYIDAINEVKPEESEITSLIKNTFKGHVADDSFNGKVQLTIFSEPNFKKTIGGTGNSATFYTDYSNILFKGLQEVKNGEFTGNFILPKASKATIYFQAISEDGTHKYAGKLADLAVNNVDSSSTRSDITGPTVHFELDEVNNTINITLSDSSGINTSSNSFFQGIFLKIDDDTLINVSSMYKVLEDYTNGTIKWQMIPLKDGLHSIVLKVADNYNNPSEAAFSFTLANQKIALKILDINLYPNPVEDFVHLKVVQNKLGADLDLKMSVYNMNGQELYQKDLLCQNCKQTEKFGLNLESITSEAGIYFYKITIIDKLLNQSDTVTKRLIFWK